MKLHYLNLELKSIKGEYWLPIPSYEGYYEVSNLGRVKSLITVGCWGRENILKQTIHEFGYLLVGLYKNKKSRLIRVHRLVGAAFIQNPYNYKDINHKRGNKKDNREWMLEWCTRSYNLKHSYKLGLSIPAWLGVRGVDNPHSKPVIQYDLNDTVIGVYSSAVEASQKTGISKSHIGCVCKGVRKTTGGYIWKYSSPLTTV